MILKVDGVFNPTATMGLTIGVNGGGFKFIRMK